MRALLSFLVIMMGYGAFLPFVAAEPRDTGKGFKMADKLSETTRKEIFKEIAEAEIRADADADNLHPRPSSMEPGYTEEKFNQQFNRMMLAAWDLDSKYKSNVAKKHGLDREQVVAISVEGVKKKWPGCGELDPKRNPGKEVSDPETRQRDWDSFQKGLANDKVRILGVYNVGHDVPCRLVELIIHGCNAPVDLIEFRQEKPSQAPSGYQVPYLEHALDQDGAAILADDYTLGKKPELWEGDVRLVFFIHFLDPFLPLRTPFGYVLLPKATSLPDRLNIVKYEPVG